jgi:hypothetical protein
MRGKPLSAQEETTCKKAVSYVKDMKMKNDWLD